MYLTHVDTTFTATLTNDSIARQEAIACLNTNSYCTLTDIDWIFLCMAHLSFIKLTAV